MGQLLKPQRLQRKDKPVAAKVFWISFQMAKETMSILLFVIAVICYVVSQLQQHGKLKWMDEKKPFGFWGEKSDYRKYKMNDDYVLVPNKRNWYYRRFKIKYKERWFTSTWLTVGLSDGYHACQSLMKIFLCASIALYKPIFDVWWWNAIGFWLLFGGIFSLFYRLLSRQDQPKAE